MKDCLISADYICDNGDNDDNNDKDNEDLKSSHNDRFFSLAY